MTERGEREGVREAIARALSLHDQQQGGIGRKLAQTYPFAAASIALDALAPFVVFRSELEQVGWSEDYHDDDDAVIGYSVFGGHDPDHSWNDWERHDGARYGSWAVYRIREVPE